MIYGNQSYNLLSNQRPTCSTPEVRNHPQLGFLGVVKCGDQYQFNSFFFFFFFADTLQQLVTRPDHNKLAAVLILLPDKSLLIMVRPNWELCRLESHTHFGMGAIIAALGPAEIKEMALYIEFLAVRDWTENPTPFDVAFVVLV